MKNAIAILETALEACEGKEPILRAGGDVEQADLEARTAREIRQAMTVLVAVDTCLTWPAPAPR